MHDIFLSYSHKDKELADMMLNILEQYGIKCWIDSRDALPGDSFAASIVHAIKSCKFFVLLLSTASGDSAHVLNEVNSAVKAGKTIIPFKIDDYEMSEGLEYYLGKTQWLEAISPPMEAHMKDLAATILGWLKMQPVPRPQPVPLSDARNKDVCKILSFQELLSLGYTAKTIALQLVENDYINCNGIGEENEGTAAQWEEFLQNDSDTFHYLINGEKKIVGDWSLVALTDSAYALAEKGQLLEKNIDAENSVMICFPGEYNGYILSFSLLPEYRTRQNYNLLIDSFLKQLEEYSENGIFFRKWIINVFGHEVESLIKPLGFRYLCDNICFGKVYSCSFNPLPDIPLIKKYPRLMQNYANR